ncbi:MAG: hypothetical protein WAU72_02905 [Acidimicrobiia bacterium]
MDNNVLVILIVVVVNIFLLIFVAMISRIKKRKNFDQHLTDRVLNPKFVESLRDEIHRTIERRVEESLTNFSNTNLSMNEQLKLTSTKAAADFLQNSTKKIENIYAEHADKLSTMTLDAENVLAAQVDKFTQQINQTSAVAIPAQMEKLVIQIQEIQNRVIPARVNDFENKMSEMSLELENIESDISNYLDEYKNQVRERISKIVDEHAVEVLSNYLNASLSGIEFGEQQDFILERLEQNKIALKNELGA